MKTSNNVLVLNADYTILEIVDWEKAFSLLFRKVVRLVEDYSGRVVRTPNETFKFPAVVAHFKYRKHQRGLAFNRSNLLARDQYTCQYCGMQPRLKDGSPDLQMLTLDHVIPRCRGKKGKVKVPWRKRPVGVTSWFNILTSCSSCNGRKGSLSVKESGYKMKKIPRPPTVGEAQWMRLFQYKVPDEWQDFIPENSPWRDYWTVELDPS
jgi:5-methylcytosine-specific restriction endonuclease McrA